MKSRNFFLELALAAIFLPLSCTLPVSCFDGIDGRVTVMTWNAQTFFDATEDGSEFDEFRGPKSSWSEEKYLDRLDRLCDAIVLCGKEIGMESGAGPDIVVLEEIENARVIRDVCNRLPQRSTYRHASFVPPAGCSPFGCAILSRYPVLRVNAHSVEGGDLSLRPILETVLSVDGVELTVFAVHLKSKANGGGGSDEKARRAQETLLASLIDSCLPDSFWLACGDFNQGRDEFLEMNKYANCWDFRTDGRNNGKTSGPEGSYWYNGNWEAIDHVFVPQGCIDEGGEGWKVGSFTVVAEAPVAGEDFKPNRYEVFSGKGCSDHLPLVMSLEKR